MITFAVICPDGSGTVKSAKVVTAPIVSVNHTKDVINANSVILYKQFQELIKRPASLAIP